MRPNQYHIAELISKYLRNQLSEEGQVILQHWLEEHEDNRRLLESFRNMEQVQQDIDFIRGIDAEVAWSKMRRQSHGLRWKRIMHAMRYVGYAATITIVLWIWFSRPQDTVAKPNRTEVGNIFYNDVKPGGNKAQLILSDGRTVDLRAYADKLQEQDGTEIVGSEGSLTYAAKAMDNGDLIYNTLLIPKAGTYHLTLSDGTKVWLNAMSELTFPVHFGHKERTVQLKGEAYFEVAPDATKPFLVEVGGAQVHVLGTHFNINAYAQVAATLLEGAITISNKGKVQSLKPGEEAQVGHDITLQPANIEKAIAWKNGDFYFKSDDIKEIMAQLSRWYDISVNFEDEPPTERFNGNIQRSSNLSEVLDMLSYASGATFEVSGQQVSVRFLTNPLIT
ncbi:FecR family protein [Parapedobacter koreensis]|uniref:FecR family protein n=1 Tax=Parapedobacter koreensis TaxID=332977 RepID=A0A1H7RT01_9SPHI|nr:FecR family protein [Parapedobacter koreensis]SEL62904.1 FecR family protein [Parapedobacter koreensis]